MVFIFSKKMLLSTTVETWGYVYDIIVLKSGIYSVINLLKVFLSVKRLKVPPVLLLAIKM